MLKEPVRSQRLIANFGVWSFYTPRCHLLDTDLTDVIHKRESEIKQTKTRGTIRATSHNYVDIYREWKVE